MSIEFVGREAWPVQVFRYSQTSDRGWETDDSNADITAAPKKGAIEITRFRVRIRCFPSEDDNLKHDGASDYVTKRLDMIHIPTRNGVGAIVLKFQSQEECNEFFDRLATLNPKKTIPKEAVAIDKTTPEDEDPVARRRKLDTLSCIVRLVHDKDFLHFVDDIEDTLAASPDGAAILSALGSRNASNAVDEKQQD